MAYMDRGTGKMVGEGIPYDPSRAPFHQEDWYLEQVPDPTKPWEQPLPKYGAPSYGGSPPAKSAPYYPSQGMGWNSNRKTVAAPSRYGGVTTDRNSMLPSTSSPFRRLEGGSKGVGWVTPPNYGGGVAGPQPRLPYAPDMPQMPGPAGALPAYNAPNPVGASPELTDSLGRLGGNTKLGGYGRIAAPGTPDRIGAGPNLLSLPQRVGAGPGLPGLPDSSQANQLIERMGAGFQPGTLGRENLGGPAGNNWWENQAQGQFAAGFDPGTQFQGKDIRDRMFSDADVQAMAGQRAAGTIRAFKDAEQMAAEAGARGGRVDPAQIAALRARAAIEGGGALNAAQRDAQLEAAQANAAQERAAAENVRSNYSTDLSARLGLGRMGLEAAGQAGQFGQQLRGLNQARDITQYQGGIEQRAQEIQRELAAGRLSFDQAQAALGALTQMRGQDIGYAVEGGRLGAEVRGQDIGQRAQDIGYQVEQGRQGLEGRGQDIGQRAQDIGAGFQGAQLGVEQRQQDLEAQYRAAGLNAEQARARAQMELAKRGQDIEQQNQLGRLGLEGRAQDIQYGLGTRSQDIEAGLGLGRLGMEGYGTGGQLWSGSQERINRMAMLDQELSNRSLDQQTRAELERERMQLQKELTQQEMGQRGGEFQQTFGQQGAQFQQQLGEQARQADARAQLQQQGYGQDWASQGRNLQFAQESRPWNAYIGGRPLWQIPAAMDIFGNTSPYNQQAADDFTSSYGFPRSSSFLPRIPSGGTPRY
jgi:hypothetical protein